MQPITAEFAHQLLDAVAADHEMDIVEQFAYELPLRVIALLLGVPEADFPEIERFAYDFARGSELAVEANERSRRADDAAHGFRDYFSRLIARRRDDPRDDVLSALVAAEDDGRRLGHEEVIATAVLLMQAGHETTTDTIGNSLVALFRHPEQLDRLRRDDAITKNAVEELVRFDPTNQINNRLLLDDMVIGGVRVPAGDHVAIFIGAANRDPARFEQPDELDLGRSIPQHLGFAFGAYYCVGNALARAELHVALRTLLDRLPGLHPAGETFEWQHPAQPRAAAATRRLVTRSRMYGASPGDAQPNVWRVAW